jgi:hypothetical protein
MIGRCISVCHKKTWCFSKKTTGLSEKIKGTFMSAGDVHEFSRINYQVFLVEWRNWEPQTYNLSTSDKSTSVLFQSCKMLSHYITIQVSIYYISIYIVNFLFTISKLDESFLLEGEIMTYFGRTTLSNFGQWIRPWNIPLRAHVTTRVST